MGILLVLSLLQLLAVPSFSLTQPSGDYWGEYGPFGHCSRPCGTGVALRTRTCVTARTDGGHNCVGTSKSYRTCNMQECPAGTRDFREEQCSQFDRADFQSKRYNWVPYYGAANPCELHCVPRGETFNYRHRVAVVDGTPCYVGRRDICVEGVCRRVSHGEILGMDQDLSPHAPAPPAPHHRDSRVYAYTFSAYSECSVACNGGLQTRSVQCVSQDSASPHVVDDIYCITQGIQRPAVQRACNVHQCGHAEYSVSSFSGCSVSCGEGQQTREVFCVGAGGERVAEHGCSGLARPVAVQACRKPACHSHISWHVADFGLCSRSCGGGVRERRVACYDTDLHPHVEDSCGAYARPPSVESCNTQACPGAQLVPSVQDPRGHEASMRGFVPHVAGEPSASIVYDPYTTAVRPHCAQSYYGCCPDGQTSKTGPRGEGCSQADCVQTRFGCCLDGLTPALGFGRAGCSEYSTPRDHTPVARPHSGDMCTMARDAGHCDRWVARFYYDSSIGRCTEFWWGGCGGNSNTFVSEAACRTECGGAASPPAGPVRRAHTRLRTYRARARA